MGRSKKTQAAFDNRLDELDEVASTYRVVMDPEEARELLAEFGDKVIALDFETTGLNPSTAKVRLSCTYHPDHGVLLFDHFQCGSFGDLAVHMMDPLWAVYNAKFEVRWFDHYYPNQVDLIDVDFLAKVHRGGGHSSLAVMARRDLGVILEKEEQISDWGKARLTNSQLLYAARDAVITYWLYEHWLEKLSPAQREAVWTFQDAVRPTVECEDTGLVLDSDYHMDTNIVMWKRKQEVALRRVRNWTNEVILQNPGSDRQVSDLLKTQLGEATLRAWPKTPKDQLKLARGEIQPLIAKAGYPFTRWGNALLRFRYYRKYLSTYGETLVTKQLLEDRISFRLNIGAAATGRYSSSSINIQNIPRNPKVRKAFLPPAGYEFLVVADYSGIEVRVLAEISQDEKLLEDSIYGDVHSGSASAIYKVDLDEFLKVIKEPDEDEDGNPIQHSQQYYMFKEMRSKAKGFTFQNVYGAGALALSIVLGCSIEEAEDALKAWAARYPKAFNYRHIIFDKMSHRGYLPVIDGRTVFVSRQDRTLPIAANYGIQGAAASIMLRAMHHVRVLRDELSDRNRIRLCATVHDELLLAAETEADVPLAKKILTDGMIRGYLDVFPGTSTDNLVEAAHGRTWGDAK